MATTLELIRGATTLDISDEINFVHEANEGFGMPPLHRLVERGPFQHGMTDRGYRLDPRIVQLVIPMLATWDTHFDRRAALLDILNPVYEQAILLRFTLPDGSRRQLDCHADRGPLFATDDQIAGGASMRAGFSLVAPDPAFYDPDAGDVTFQLGGGGTALEIPMPVPHTVGASTVDQVTAIDYAGSWLSYPFIRITGPITDPVVTNETTGEELDFTGYTIAAGHYYDIDLRYGYKTVTLDGATNKIAELSAGSDLATFHLAANQTNSIRVAGSSVTAATKVEVTYYTRYLGI